MRVEVGVNTGVGGGVKLRLVLGCIRVVVGVVARVKLELELR